LQEKNANGQNKYAAFYRGSDRRFQTGTPQKSALERAGEMLRGKAVLNQLSGRGSDSVKLTEGNQIVQLLTEIREGIGDFTAV